MTAAAPDLVANSREIVSSTVREPVTTTQSRPTEIAWPPLDGRVLSKYPMALVTQLGPPPNSCCVRCKAVCTASNPMGPSCPDASADHCRVNTPGQAPVAQPTVPHRPVPGRP